MRTFGAVLIGVFGVEVEVQLVLVVHDVATQLADYVARSN